jgi:hypothetical protein
MATITFNEEQVEEAAEAWWRSLSPDLRGVYLQAAWEVNGCPEAKVKERKPRNPKAMRPEEWESRVRDLCAKSARGKLLPKDVGTLQRLRDMNVTRFHEIGNEESARARAELNPFAGLGGIRNA